MPITISYGATSIGLPNPDFGYKTTIDFPFDMVDLDSGMFSARDEGTSYDNRKCECEFILSETEANNLNTMLRSTARAQVMTLSLPASDGFFPFGADKGDAGNFTVSARIAKTGAIQHHPFRRFRVGVEFINTGNWPVYALPAEVSDGVYTIGNVSELREPISMFEPNQLYNVDVDFTADNVPKFFDRGADSDIAKTKFNLTSNESKMAALLDYIASTARATEFQMKTPQYAYPFGRDHDVAWTYTVQLSNKTLTCTHENYNRFTLGIELINKTVTDITWWQETLDTGTEYQETLATGDEYQEISF